MPPKAALYARQARKHKGFSVDGLTEVKAALSQLPEAFRAVVADSIAIGSNIILMEAVGRVPFRDGDLKASLKRNVRSDGLQATVQATDYKAFWNEFGTSDTPAQPFMRPAFKLGAKYVRGRVRGWAKEAGEKVRTRTKNRKVKKVAA